MYRMKPTLAGNKIKTKDALVDILYTCDLRIKQCQLGCIVTVIVEFSSPI